MHLFKIGEIMKLYLEMLKKPVFTIEDAMTVCANSGTAKNHLVKLVSDGYVSRIRKNLYTCISPETGFPVADRYQIASAITKDSFVSHHSALEYYGVTDQVFYEVYVSSTTKFQDFEFDGYTFKCILIKDTSEVECPRFSNGVRVSSVERAVIESIKDMDKVSGAEEVIAAIEAFPLLHEDKMLKRLERYANQFLYQKTGFVMERFKERFNLSEAFFECCKEKAGMSKRYFSNDMKCKNWNKEWQLMVPENLFNMKNGVLNGFE